MRSKKRKLTGAAKTAKEDRLARDQARKDPVKFELRELAAAGVAGKTSRGTLEDAKSRAEGYSRRNKNDKTPEILLGCLKEFPQNLIRDILARDDTYLGNLADDIRGWIFFPMKANGGRTPACSPSPSAPSSSSTSEEKSDKSMLKKAVKSRSGQAKLKATCLSRESNRCIITSLHDLEKAKTLEEQPDTLTISTECAHIIPYSAAPASVLGNVSTVELEQKAKTWAFLYRYFPTIRELIDVFSAEAINSPRNAMTMASFMHTEFGNFRLAFEAIGPHRYKLKTFPWFSSALSIYLPADRTVQFHSADGTELPDPQLLAFHLAIANVLHATEMGEEIERYIVEMEEEGSDIPGDMGMGVEVKVHDWLMASA